MTREERLAILGPKTVAAIHERAKDAPEPSDELVEERRRIINRPARATAARKRVPPLPRPRCAARGHERNGELPATPPHQVGPSEGLPGDAARPSAR